MKTNQNLHKMAMAKRSARGVLLIRYCMFFALLLMGAASSFAQTTRTSVASGNWSDAATWVGGVVPVANDNVIIAATHTVTLTGNTVINGNGFGERLTVLGTLNTAGFDLTVNGSITAGTTTSPTGPRTINTGSGGVVTQNWTGTQQTPIIITGSGGFTRLGSGATSFNRDQTYTGTTTIGAGATLGIGFNTTTGSISSSSIVNNGTLNLNRSNAYTLAANISGTGNVNKWRNSTVTLSGNNTYTGTTTIGGAVSSGGGGTLVIANANALPAATSVVFPASNPGKMQLNANVSCASLLYGAVTQPNGSYGSTSSSATNKNDTYFSGTGVLNVGPSDKVSNQTGNWDNPAIWTPYGVPVLNDNVRVFPGHTVTLNSAVNTGTGKLQVDGTLALAGFDMTAGALVGNGTISSASGTPTLTVGSNNTNDIWNGAYSGTGARFTKVGTGSFFFAGGLSPNTYTGATTINAGRVQIATANERLSNSTDVFVASGAIFDLGGRTETVRSLAGAGTVTSVFNGGVLIVSGPANTTFSGILQNGTSGTLALTKAGTGTLTLTGANTYTGATNVSAGTLQLGGANERISNSSALTVAAGAFFDLNGFSETIGSLAGAGTVTSSVAGPATITHGSNSSSTFSGVIQNGSGTVALTKSGTGTLTLTGANTYTGATSITAGTLIAGNSTALGSGSSVSVSSGATLRTNAGLSLGSLSIAGVMNCNGNNSTCTNLILGTTVQTNSGTYGSTASGATYQNNARFTSTSTGVVTLTIPLVPSTFPGGTAIQARARWGATGYEGGLFIGGTVGPQLNPAGAPVWVIGTAYKFEYGYNSSTGEQKLSIDFNGDNSFGTGEVIMQSTTYADQGFKHFSIFMSGDATRGIALNNFVVNGVNLGNHVSPATGSLDLDWENPAGLFSDITATGTITFTGATGGSGEVGRIWFRTAVPQPLVTPTQGRIQGIPKDMMEALGTNAVLSLHPNPTVTGQVTFRIPMDGLRPNNGKLSSTVEVFDYTGSMKMSRGVTLDNTGRGELDASSLIRGAYIIRVKVAGKAFTTRMIRQ